jgi:hypothetical protein
VGGAVKRGHVKCMFSSTEQAWQSAGDLGEDWLLEAATGADELGRKSRQLSERLHVMRGSTRARMRTNGYKDVGYRTWSCSRTHQRYPSIHRISNATITFQQHPKWPPHQHRRTTGRSKRFQQHSCSVSYRMAVRIHSSLRRLDVVLTSRSPDYLTRLMIATKGQCSNAMYVDSISFRKNLPDAVVGQGRI